MSYLVNYSKYNAVTIIIINYYELIWIKVDQILIWIKILIDRILIWIKIG